MGVGLWVSRHITPRYFKQNNPNEITNFTTLSYLFSFSLLHRHYIVLVKYIKIHISMKVKPIQVVYARKFDSICKIWGEKMGAPKTFTLVRKTLERMHVIQQKAFQSLRVVKLGLLGLLK